MPLPPAFRVTETDGSLVIEWDNRRVGQFYFTCLILAITLVFFGSGAFFLSYDYIGVLSDPPRERITDDGGCWCFLPLFWCATFVLLFCLARRTWLESVEVTRDAITHTQIGWYTPEPDVYPLATVTKLAIGWNQSNTSDDPVYNVCVYVVRSGGWFTSICVLGGQLAGPGLEQLFLTIRDFATRNNIPLAFEERGTRPDWAQM